MVLWNVAEFPRNQEEGEERKEEERREGESRERREKEKGVETEKRGKERGEGFIRGL